jgi:hypothetical protein
MLKLSGICLVDAACVHPEVAQAITLGLLRTELDLSISSLVVTGIAPQLVKGHFFIFLPGM